MKKNSTKTMMFLLLTMFVSNVFAQTPWKCDGRAIGTYGSTESWSATTNLYTAAFTPTGDVTYLTKANTTTGIGLNAIGFRKQDGFVYGIRYEDTRSGHSNDKNELCRIDSSGTITSLGIVPNLTRQPYYAGGIDASGFLYVVGYDDNKLYKVTVTGTIGAVAIPATGNTTTGQNFVDIAFDPITNVLYGTSSATLYTINTTTGSSTKVGSTYSGNMFGLFFTDGAELYGFGTSTGGTTYYKINKADGTRIAAGSGPTATRADACSCPFRLSHTLKAKSDCLLAGQDSVFEVAITNITASAQPTTFDLTMDKRFSFTETAAQIKANIQTAFPGSSAVVTISSANTGTNNVISVNSINVPVTTSIPASFKLAWKASANGFTYGEKILFQSTIDVPANALNIGADLSDDPLTAQLDDATTLTVCTPQGGPLPVTLTDFKGRLDQKTADLSWTTAQELNIQKFEIERSIDGINFSVVNSVAASRQNASTYQYTDINVPGSTVYYRLRMVDNNGSYRYSSIVVLKMNGQLKTTTVYPSPFRDKMAINTYAESKMKITVLLTDATGRKITEKISSVESGSNTITLNNLEKLQTGLYFIQIYNNDKLTETKRAVKVQ